MKKSLIHFLLSCVVILLLHSCTAQKVINIDYSDTIFKPFYKWTLEECSAVYNQFTISNAKSYITGSGIVTSQDVDLYAEVTYYSPEVLKAKSREEGILKRLPDNRIKELYAENLSLYTNYKYDINKDSIYADPEFTRDSLKGNTFKFHFENRTDPYEMIAVKDGYEYFFLENKEGRFSRVIEISGLFAERDIYISGNLDVELTFSAFDDNGKILFLDNSIFEGFNIIINKLLDEPVVINWSPD